MKALGAVSILLWAMTLVAARANPGGVSGYLPGAAVLSSLALAAWAVA